jgi:hypothetical protein
MTKKKNEVEKDDFIVESVVLCKYPLKATTILYNFPTL